MVEKNVPGFCTELKEAMTILEVDEKSELLKEQGKEIRTETIKKESDWGTEKENCGENDGRIVERMMVKSKADRILLNYFVFNRKPKSYLLE